MCKNTSRPKRPAVLFLALHYVREAGHKKNECVLLGHEDSTHLLKFYSFKNWYSNIQASRAKCNKKSFSL